jgi:hypothetical protein
MSDYGVRKLRVVDEHGTGMNLTGVIASLDLIGWLAKRRSTQDEEPGSLTNMREGADGGPTTRRRAITPGADLSATTATGTLLLLPSDESPGSVDLDPDARVFLASPPR